MRSSPSRLHPHPQSEYSLMSTKWPFLMPALQPLCLSRPRRDKGRVLHFAASPAQTASPFESSVLSDAGAAEACLLNTKCTGKRTASLLKVIYIHAESDFFGSSCKHRCAATSQAQVPVWSDETCALQVLDAPALIDDFYLNLLDWSQQGLLAVALGLHIYIYNTITCKASNCVSNIISCKPNGHVCRCMLQQQYDI